MGLMATYLPARNASRAELGDWVIKVAMTGYKNPSRRRHNEIDSASKDRYGKAVTAVLARW